MNISFSKKQLIFFAVLVSLVIFFKVFDIGRFISLEGIQEYRSELEQFVQNNYFSAVLIFSVIYILAVSLSIPAAPLTLLGGFLFGLIPGIIIVLISATLGSGFGFLVVRYIFGHDLQKKYKKELKRFNEEIERNGIYYLTTLRLTFIIPFFLINILAGLTKIPLSHFLISTFIGIIPATVIYTYTGKQLQTIKHLKDVFSPNILFMFLILIMLALIPIIFRKWKERKIPQVQNEKEKI